MVEICTEKYVLKKKSILIFFFLETRHVDSPFVVLTTSRLVIRL